MNYPGNVAIIMHFSAGHGTFGKEPLGVLALDEQRLFEIDRTLSGAGLR